MKGPFSVVLFVACGLVGASWVGAQDPGGDPGQAKKADGPSPSAFPSGYLDHSSLTDAVGRVAAAHPDLVKVDSLARSKEGRDVWIATIGPASKGAPAKPSILVVANLEADHLVGSQVALGLIERLAGADPKTLEGHTIYIVPRLNPDGAERLLKGAPRTDIRANLTSIDRDRDGKQNEDGPNDLDGDGLALSMRFKDAKASLVPDAKDPRILRKADVAKGEKPVYSESTEGLDDDGDGSIDEDPVGGVNLNRNWPHGWLEYNPQTGAYPTSEPEVSGLIRFAYAHPEIVAVWSFGLNDNLRGNPTTLPADAPHLAEIVKAFAAATAPKPEAPKEESKKEEPKKEEPKKEEPKKEEPKAEAPKEEPAKKAEAPPQVPLVDAPSPKAQGQGGRGGRGGAGGVQGGRGGRGGGGGAAPAAPAASAPAPGLEGTTDGACSEWAYQQFGVVGLSSRLWSRPETSPGSPALSGEGEARWLEWNDKVMGGSAFVPFHTVDHPTLGKVEVGGWKPGVRLNPPIEQVGAIVESHFTFLKDLAGRMPSLSIKEAKAEAKGGGLFEIKATVENLGILPTSLSQGVVTRKSPPVLVKLELGDAKLISGKALNRINALAGSGGSQEYRWLVVVPQGKKTLTIEATCPKAGSAKREIALP
jgi:Zinc carboxypeptidase